MEKKLKKKHEEKLNRAIDKLNDILEEIQEYIPDANYYFEGSRNLTLNVHSEPIDDDGYFGKWRKSNIYSKAIYDADCGGY